MARRKLSVEAMLVGHFSTVDLPEAEHLLDLAKGIVSAREAAGLPIAVPVRKRKPRRKINKAVPEGTEN